MERARIKILGEQVAVVVRGSPDQAIKISALTQVFTHYYGYSLKPLQYGSSSLVDLIRKLRNHVKVKSLCLSVSFSLSFLLSSLTGLICWTKCSFICSSKSASYNQVNLVWKCLISCLVPQFVNSKTITIPHVSSYCKDVLDTISVI